MTSADRSHLECPPVDTGGWSRHLYSANILKKFQPPASAGGHAQEAVQIEFGIFAQTRQQPARVAKAKPSS
ncbi:MAG: hypothetical protein KJZ84_25345 [Bryobacteraceae bacterium]|nr:hypothetical protein [Bryobacteraceae bacterium]